MKQFTVRMLAMVVAQPLAMYFFLRVLQRGAFVSAALAALVAMLVGFAIYLIQLRSRAKSLDV